VSAVRQQSKESRETLLFLLLLVRVPQSRGFRNNFVLRTNKEYLFCNQTRSGLPNTWSSYFQIPDRQVLSLLRMRQPLSNRGSKGIKYLIVPKNKREGRDRLPRYLTILQCFRRRSKVQVRTVYSACRQGQTSSFGRYNYCRIFAFEYGDRSG